MPQPRVIPTASRSRWRAALITVLSVLAAPASGCAVPSDVERKPPEDVAVDEQALTERKLQQMDALSQMVGFLRDESAWHGPIDSGMLEQNGRLAIASGDGSDGTFRAALFDAFIAHPQGHQQLRFDGCGRTLPAAGYSRRGVCGRPHSRGIVVTNARAGNRLGLTKGDLVLGFGANGGEGLVATLARRPMCATSRPSEAYRAAQVSSTFGDLLVRGEVLAVESPAGDVRSVTIDDAIDDRDELLSCRDPFGRPSVVVESWLRPDGYGVIRLPSFLDGEQSMPTEFAGLAQYDAAFVAKIVAAFDRVKGAPGIVWDVRGNDGGRTAVALTIASGFPGSFAAPLSTCQARVPGGPVPVTIDPNRGAYALEPGGPLAYGGRVAVITEGNNYSAADYFALAARLRTSAVLVGQPTAGGYGASDHTRTFEGPPRCAVTVDPHLCSLYDDGAPLEGRSVDPTYPSEYRPAELAAGIDSVLERAVLSIQR